MSHPPLSVDKVYGSLTKRPLQDDGMTIRIMDLSMYMVRNS
ncbi:MAG TPA: hypothetical protein VD884_10990 [Ohtaekwangia sp.]|nr:hypothetical protein [Ohtaekwangia sp.]